MVRILFILAGLFLLGIGSGCSTSLFTGDKKNDAQMGDGNFNKQCLGIDLSGSVVGATTARQLVQCLNSNGSIQQYANLINGLTDEQLSAVLEITNSKVVAQPHRLKQIDKSFSELDRLGIFDRSLKRLSTILSNEAFVANGLKLLNPKPASEPLDSELLTAIEIASQELSRENAAQALEMGEKWTALNSFKGMVRAFRPQAKVSLEKVAADLLDYTKIKLKSEDHALAKLLLWGFYDGTLLKGFDHYFNKSCEGVPPEKCFTSSPHLPAEYQIQAIEAFMHFLTVERPDVLEKLITLFHSMDRPIECMDGTKIMPNANMAVMNDFLTMDPLEVPQWVLSTNSIKMQLANGMCKLPAGLNSQIESLRDLADYTTRDASGREIEGHSMLVTVAHLVRGMQVGDNEPVGAGSRSLRDQIRKDIGKYVPIEQERERYRRFLFHWFGDPDTYTYLKETLTELARKERRFVGNLFYFLNSCENDDQILLQKAAGFLIVPRSRLGGKSLYDVFTKNIQNVDAKVFYKFLASLSSFINSEEDILNPFFSETRQAVLFNNVNPFLDVLKDLGTHATENERLFRTLFEITEKPEFYEAVKLTAQMAENGRLKELIYGLFAMFRNGAKGPDPVILAVPTIKKTSGEKDRAVDFTKWWSPHPPVWSKGLSACRNLNFDVIFSRPFENPAKWKEVVHTLAECAQAVHLCEKDNRESCRDIPNLVEYALSQKLGDKHSVLSFLVEQVGNFLSGKKAYDEFSDLLVDEKSFEKLVGLQGLLKFTLDRKYSADLGPHAPKVAVTQALGRSLVPIFDSLDAGTESKVQLILNSAADILVHKDAPYVLSIIHDVSKHAQELPEIRPTRRVAPFAYPLSMYGKNEKIKEDAKRLIVENEKPEANVNIDELIEAKASNYWAQLSSGTTRDKYVDAAEFKAELRPLLDKLSEPRMIEALLKFMTYLDNNPYTPEWIESWVHRLANNTKAIPYFYPGTFPDDHNPTIRIVNQLDLLELVVIDADFAPRDYGQPGFMKVNVEEHFAIKHLSRLGKYKSDQDMRPWVDAITKELKEFTGYMEGRLSSPLLKPEIKRRTKNLNQSVALLEILDRVTPAVGRDGLRHYASDLGLLRDLFQSILEAKPETVDIYDRNQNSLSLIAEMVRLGLVRNIGNHVWYRNEKGQVVANKLAPIIQFLVSTVVVREGDNRKVNPDVVAVLDHLLRKDCVKKVGTLCVSEPDFDKRYILIGKIIDQVFKATKDDKCSTPWRDTPEPSGPCNLANLKQATYWGAYLLGRIQQFQLDREGPGASFAAKLIKALRPVVVEYSGLLANHIELIDPILRSQFGTKFLKALAELEETKPEAVLPLYDLILSATHSLSESEAAKAAFGLWIKSLEDPLQRGKVATHVVQQMLNDPEFLEFKWNEIQKDIFEWLSKDSALKRRTQQYLTEQLRNGNVLLFLKLLAKESKEDQLYNHLQFLGRPGFIQGLQDFMKTLRSGLQDNYN